MPTTDEQDRRIAPLARPHFGPQGTRASIAPADGRLVVIESNGCGSASHRRGYDARLDVLIIEQDAAEDNYTIVPPIPSPLLPAPYTPIDTCLALADAERLRRLRMDGREVAVWILQAGAVRLLGPLHHGKEGWAA